MNNKPEQYLLLLIFANVNAEKVSIVVICLRGMKCESGDCIASIHHTLHSDRGRLYHFCTLIIFISSLRVLELYAERSPEVKPP